MLSSTVMKVPSPFSFMRQRVIIPEDGGNINSSEDHNDSPDLGVDSSNSSTKIDTLVLFLICYEII